MKTSVAAIEIAHRCGDVEGQLVAADRALDALDGVALALLPEASLTGYVSEDFDFDLTGFAEPVDGPTAQSLASLAQKHGLALAGPLIERDGRRCFNTTLVFDEKGRRIAHYRKRHPWLPETWATPGDLGTPTFEVAGLRCTIACCYDVHFVSQEAGAMLDASDVLLFPSAWVEEEDSRRWRLPALAKRHGLAIVNANWGVGVPEVPGQGGSRILDATGRVVARGDTVTAELIRVKR